MNCKVFVEATIIEVIITLIFTAHLLYITKILYRISKKAKNEI